jgi:hypothetical protein
MSVRSFLLATTILSGVSGVLLAPVSAQAGDAAPVQAGTLPNKSWVHHESFNAYASARAYAVAPTAPAVDGWTGRAEAVGGTIGHMSMAFGRAVVAAPVSNQTGMQLDFLAGSLGGHALGNLVGRYFWRDPAQGLYGIYAAQTAWNRFGGVYVTHVAPEFEIYRGRWTLQGLLGVEFGNSASRTVSANGLAVTAVPGGGGGGGVLTTTTTSASTFTESYNIKTRFFDQINLKYYFTDNWDGYIGHRYLGGLHALAVGTEYARPMSGNRLGSLFVEARVGQGAFEGVWGGVKVYFGQRDKSLIRRHREDDPVPWDTLFSILNNHNNSGTSNANSTSTLDCPFGFAAPGVCET